MLCGAECPRKPFETCHIDLVLRESLSRKKTCDGRSRDRAGHLEDCAGQTRCTAYVVLLIVVPPICRKGTCSVIVRTVGLFIKYQVNPYQKKVSSAAWPAQKYSQQEQACGGRGESLHPPPFLKLNVGYTLGVRDAKQRARCCPPGRRECIVEFDDETIPSDE